MKERAVKSAKYCAALLSAGCAYLIFVIKTGIRIPCVFNLITGLKCPGCGITRMFVSLASLDFSAAWGYNPAVLLMLPLIAFFTGKYIYGYIKYGTKGFSKADNAVQIAMVAVLIVFGILRNTF